MFRECRASDSTDRLVSADVLRQERRGRRWRGRRPQSSSRPGGRKYPELRPPHLWRGCSPHCRASAGTWVSRWVTCYTPCADRHGLRSERQSHARSQDAPARIRSAQALTRPHTRLKGTDGAAELQVWQRLFDEFKSPSQAILEDELQSKLHDARIVSAGRGQERWRSKVTVYTRKLSVVKSIEGFPAEFDSSWFLNCELFVNTHIEVRPVRQV